MGRYDLTERSELDEHGQPKPPADGRNPNNWETLEHVMRFADDFVTIRVGPDMSTCTIGRSQLIRLMCRAFEAGQIAGPKRNGGTICDVADGPCACGAWHTSAAGLSPEDREAVRKAGK